MAIVSPNHRFAHADFLIEWFHDPRTARPDKNPVYGRLIEAAKRGRARELASALVLLGLWPGLDHARRRVHMALKGESRTHIDLDELTNAFHWAIDTQFSKGDYTDAPNPPGAFVGRVRKQSLHALRGGRPGKRRLLNIDGLELPDEDMGLAGVDNDDALFELRRRLSEILSGSDLELLLAVRIEGLTGQEAAGRFGLTHEVVRTRLSTAKKKVLAELPDLASQFGLELSPLGWEGKNTSQGAQP